MKFVFQMNIRNYLKILVELFRYINTDNDEILNKKTIYKFKL